MRRTRPSRVTRPRVLRRSESVPILCSDRRRLTFLRTQCPVCYPDEKRETLTSPSSLVLIVSYGLFWNTLSPRNSSRKLLHSLNPVLLSPRKVLLCHVATTSDLTPTLIDIPMVYVVSYGSI